MSTRNQRFRPTPGLKRKVRECLDKLVAEGYRFRTGVYVQGNSCCALGAISVCEAGKPTTTVAGYAPSVAGGSMTLVPGRDGTDSFALSLKHLGCTPWELESIEAGFEGWPLDMVAVSRIEDDDPFSYADGANNCAATIARRVRVFNKAAWLIGQWVWETYTDDDEKSKSNYRDLVRADGTAR